LTAARWEAGVRSALGRAIPAAELPWMRIREVWLDADLAGWVTGRITAPHRPPLPRWL
jgi:maleylpyruvate isomerase